MVAVASTGAFPGVRLPRQERSRVTFDTILDTAEVLIREGGVSAVTVQEILDRTGIGSGSFYARFDSHEALMRFLALRFWAETSTGWAAFLQVDRWENASVSEVITSFIDILVRWNSLFAAELRAHLTNALLEPEGRLLDEIAEVENTVADYLVDLIASKGESIDREFPEERIRLATLQLFSTLRSRILFAPDEEEAGITDNSLARELARSFLLYIGLRMG